MVMLPPSPPGPVLDFGPYGAATRLPEGMYALRIAEANLKDSSTDSPYLEIWFEVISGPAYAESGDKFHQYYSFSGREEYRLRQLLTVTGHGEDFALPSTEHLLGLQLRGVVEKVKSKRGDRLVINRHLPSDDDSQTGGSE